MDTLKLTAKKDLNLTVNEGYDEFNNKDIKSDLNLKKGESIEIDMDESFNHQKTLSGQLPTGEMIYGLKSSDFKIEVLPE